MQQELYDALARVCGEKGKLRFEDGNTLVWIEHEELLNVPDGQYRVSLKRKDNIDYYETVAIVKLADGFRAYRWRDDGKDEDELSPKDLKYVKERVEHALKHGMQLSS